MMERIYHTWDEWECYPAGFYENHPPAGMTQEDCEKAYAELLVDLPRFERALWRVIHEWKNSSEHYLTNENMNRIAWLGQAACCIELGIPSTFRGGFNKLTDEQKQSANHAALRALNIWLVEHGEKALTIDEAASKTKQNLY